MSKKKNDCSSSWNVYSDKIIKGKVLPSSYPLRIATIAGSYKDLLYLDNNNTGITASFKNLYDGMGRFTNIKISNDKCEINTNGGFISDPIIGSSLKYLQKINIKDTQTEYEISAINSPSIMFSYRNPGATATKNFISNIVIDSLFENMETFSDEFLISEFSFHLVNYSNAQINITINFIYKDQLSDSSITLTVYGSNYVNISKTFAIVQLYTFPNLKIESVEIKNA